MIIYGSFVPHSGSHWLAPSGSLQKWQREALKGEACKTSGCVLDGPGLLSHEKIHKRSLKKNKEKHFCPDIKSFSMINAYLRKKRALNKLYVQWKSKSLRSPSIALFSLKQTIIKFPVVLFWVVIHRSRAWEPSQGHLSMLQTVVALPW